MKRRRGFTLMELTLVIAVIGVLAAILLPALARAREAGRRTSCVSQLMNMSIAFQAYASEHERQLPWSGGNGGAHCLLDFRADYLPDAEIFICPSDSDGGWRSEYRKDPAKALNARRGEQFSLRTSYDYMGAYANAPITLPANPLQCPRVPIMWDLSDSVGLFNHIPGGANVLFLDGSIEFMKNEEFFLKWLPVQPEGVAYTPLPEPPKETMDEKVFRSNRSRFR